MKYSVTITTCYPIDILEGILLIYPKIVSEPLLFAPYMKGVIARNGNDILPFLIETKALHFDEKTLDEISKTFNLPKLSGIIDGEILCDYDLSIDGLSGTMVCFLPTKRESFGDVSLEVKSVSNLPVTELLIGGELGKTAFVFSSYLNYVEPELVKDKEPVKKNIEAKFMGYCSFTTDIYELPVNIGFHKINMLFGILPDDLREKMNEEGIKRILGGEILTEFYLYVSLTYGYVILSKLKEKVASFGTKERWQQKIKYTSNMYLRDARIAEDYQEGFLDKETKKLIQSRIDFLGYGTTRLYLEKILKLADKNK